MSSVITRPNNHGEIAKPAELNKVIPTYITECAIFLNKGDGEPCSDANTISDIGFITEVKSKDPVVIIREAIAKTGCDSERCVLEKLARDLGEQKVSAIIATRFKLKGPTDVSLLNNFNIDNTLAQFRHKFTDFYAYNFNMLNYRDYSFRNNRVVSGPDTLETIRIADLIPQYKTAACVINTDTYQGNGKHWMALFADWRDPNSASVEFFNSSGNGPAQPWLLWMERTRDAFKSFGFKLKHVEDHGFKSETIRVTRLCHQNTKTECGVYSLFYIYARLCGIPFEYFANTFVPDQLIIEFRQHLFSGEHSLCVGGAHKFDWNKYNRAVNVKWETR